MKETILIDEAAIAKRVSELAEQMNADYRGRELLVIAIANGALLFASDFTKYFTIFHEIFFTNDLWLFDPATDYMIRMLPEGFFYDMVMRIGAWFVGGLVLLFAVMAGWRQRALWKFWERHKKNDRKSTDSQ